MHCPKKEYVCKDVEFDKVNDTILNDNVMYNQSEVRAKRNICKLYKEILEFSTVFTNY